MTQTHIAPLIAQDLQITDDAGVVRMRLSARSGIPTLEMFSASGATGLTVALGEAGRPAIHLFGPNGAPTAQLEIDDKGAHVRFDLTGGASSYLFLSNHAVSGVVLSDAKGQRRFEATLGPDGAPTLARYGEDGGSLP